MIGESIFTQAATMGTLHKRVRDTVRCHFEAVDQPKIIRLHLIGIAGCGSAIRAQIARKLRRIEPPTLMVRQHGPEPSQSFGGDAGTELRSISFR